MKTNLFPARLDVDGEDLVLDGGGVAIFAQHLLVSCEYCVNVHARKIRLTDKTDKQTNTDKQYVSECIRANDKKNKHLSAHFHLLDAAQEGLLERNAEIPLNGCVLHSLRALGLCGVTSGGTKACATNTPTTKCTLYITILISIYIFIYTVLYIEIGLDSCNYY